MKLMHLADLHLGKRVNNFSMLEDQKDILGKIIDIVRSEQPQAVLIAGDVYDRTVPPEEAVNMFDDFLVSLMKLGKEVYIINGNHDSADRVSFGGRIMDKSGIHFAPLYNGEITPLELSDEYGTVNFWLIPFLKPTDVRHYYPDADIKSYTDAMQMVVDNMDINTAVRNVALVHQFISGAKVCDSEDGCAVGGIDNIPAEVFDPFDYVALGHLHGPQHIGRETVRYSGSPLKYSFSECGQKKGVTIVELGEKGNVKINNMPLKPMRDMVTIEGRFAELTAIGEKSDDYCSVTLFDDDEPVNAFARLREVYPNIMTMAYDNKRTRENQEIIKAKRVEQKTTLQLMEELFKMINNSPMTDEQREYITLIGQQLSEEARI